MSDICSQSIVSIIIHVFINVMNVRGAIIVTIVIVFTPITGTVLYDPRVIALRTNGLASRVPCAANALRDCATVVFW